MSDKAAKKAEKSINNSSKPVLGLATGKTFTGFYKKLVEKHNKKKISFSNITTFNLDEYVGLPSDHPESFHSYMENNLFKDVKIPNQNYHIPNGTAENLKKECEEYEIKIKNAGGINTQFLGIGENGHIGYNEPGSPHDSRTRVVKLTEETQKNKKEYFESRKVPEKAITMGIGTILEADQIFLLASGEEKAEAVKKTVEGPITKDIPSSALQKHDNCTLIIDEEASTYLPKT